MQRKMGDMMKKMGKMGKKGMMRQLGGLFRAHAGQFLFEFAPDDHGVGGLQIVGQGGALIVTAPLGALLVSTLPMAAVPSSIERVRPKSS